jgi:hypothetical protein
MNSDYTIIIQGPLNSISINNLEKYSQFGKIIISTWSNNNILSNDLLSYIKQYADITIQDPPKIIKNKFYNKANILYQIVSTFNGIIRTDTKFCIKVRSDEKFTDLSTLVNKHQKNHEKIICSNIFFRKPLSYLYHISDHIICGQTNLLAKSLSSAINLCQNQYSIMQILNKFSRLPVTTKLVPEQIICLCILQNMISTNATIINYNNKSLCIELMKKYFDIINVDDLGDIIVSFKDFAKPTIRHSVSATKSYLDKNTDTTSLLSF